MPDEKRAGQATRPSVMDGIERAKDRARSVRSQAIELANRIVGPAPPETSDTSKRSSSFDGGLLLQIDEASIDIAGTLDDAMSALSRILDRLPPGEDYGREIQSMLKNAAVHQNALR